jgi:methylmalonyl-CoA/ethylmalonyl-CoA epimerase
MRLSRIKFYQDNEVNTMSEVAPIKPLHVGISVADMDESIEWYKTMLGFELEERVYVDLIPATVAMLRNDQFLIELFALEDAKPLPEERRIPNQDIRTHGTKHICYAVEDVSEMVESIRAKGGDIVFENVVNNTPMAFIRDNTGNLIEFIETPELF